MPEAAKLLDVRPVLEELAILEGSAVFRIVSHQILSEEDAGVETFSNRCVNNTYEVHN